MAELNYAPIATAYTTMWDDMPTQACIDFVRKMHPSGHHGAFSLDEPPPLETGFEDRAYAVLGYRFHIDQMKWWVSIIHKDTSVSKTNPLWVEGFPHAHGWDNGRTLVQLIQLPYEGGELVVWNDDKECSPLDLKPGLGIVVHGQTRHGVRPVREDRQRITMIATAFGRSTGDG